MHAFSLAWWSIFKKERFNSGFFDENWKENSLADVAVLSFLLYLRVGRFTEIIYIDFLIKIIDNN